MQEGQYMVSSSGKSAGTRRTALVTGAAGGIGGAIASALFQAGCAVVAVDRELPKEPTDVSPWRWYDCDLASAESIANLLARMKRDALQIDVLVNCAGINRQKSDGGRFSLEEVNDAGWALTMAINLTAPFLLCRGLVPDMKARGWGRIVNIASRAGRTYVAASNVDYSASKAGLVGLTRMIAGECAEFGVTANCVAPGRISTPLADTQSAEIIQASLSGIPVKRVGHPMEIGAAVAYLASEAAGFVTGVTLDINGGAFMP